MKAYLPFGDWSGDGHSHYEDVLVDIKSMDDLLTAQKKIKEKYGENFFNNYANTYDHPKLSKECWQALIDHNISIDILEDSEMIDLEDIDNDTICNINDFLRKYPDPYVSLEFVEYSFIWLLNQYGANITFLPEDEDIPQINNWTCPGFQTAGYGCFS